jgi:N-dimethylarginine dimethylaminohydrolase
MTQISLNQTVIMSGVDYFDDQAAINPFMDASVAIDREQAAHEHRAIQAAFESAGITVHKVDPPVDCQDGVYAANWGLERNGTVVLASLPNARKGEEPYAEQIFTQQGKTVVHVPDGLHFSGQGDALPCGNLLFCGSGYRSDAKAQAFVAETLGYERIQLQTIPERDENGQPVINSYSGWPDSFFYDIDLALSILKAPQGDQKGLIAWCPDAFMPESQEILRNLDTVDKIEVSYRDATEVYACNLVSTGEHVIMNQGAAEFEAALREHGLTPVTLSNTELAKGGGSIRCTSVTVSNT